MLAPTRPFIIAFSWGFFLFRLNQGCSKSPLVAHGGPVYALQAGLVESSHTSFPNFNIWYLLLAEVILGVTRESLFHF